MNENLSDILRNFVDAEGRAAAATASDPVNEAQLLSRRVVRRRALRTSGTAVAVAAAVVTVVAGVHAWVPEARTPAAHTHLASHPSPSPSVPSPSAVASLPAVTSTAPAALPGVTTDPLLPVAEPMTPGLLEVTDSSWRLLRYQPFADLQGKGAPAVVYLLGPDARLYEVPTPSDPATWYLLDWLPGSPLALVEPAFGGSKRVIDLLSGATVLDLGEKISDERFSHDGTHDVVYSAKGKLWRVSTDNSLRATSSSFSVPYGTTAAWMPRPDGSAIVVSDARGPRVLTSTDFTPMGMPSPYPGRPDACRAWMWVGELDVLVECAKGGAQQFQLAAQDEFWLTTVGGSPRLLSSVPDASRFGGLWQVGDRLVAGSFGAGETEASWSEVGEQGTVPLSTTMTPELTVLDVRGTELIAISSSWSAGRTTVVQSLVAIDPFRGTTRTLLAMPPAAATSFSAVPSSLVGPPQTGIGG